MLAQELETSRGTIAWRISQVINVLFWLALGYLLFAQLTKFYIFYDGNGERMLHLALAGIVFSLDFTRRRITVVRVIEGSIAVVLFVATFVYFWNARIDIIMRSGLGTTADIVAMVVVLLLCLRLSKTVYGWTFPIIAVCAVFYSLYAYVFPGILHGPDLGWERVGSRYATEMHGSFTILTTNYLWLLIFWGMLLSVSGVSISMVKLANVIARYIKAGPAMVCLVASALVGSTTGGGPSNTLITGPITIPAMKNAGYTPAEAASVEALASHGSAITPPVMGAVAFIMASLLGISYLKVVIMVLPVMMLWYLGVLVYLFAHFRNNTSRISNTIAIGDDANVSNSVVWRSALTGVIPLMVLIYMLYEGFTLRQSIWVTFITFIAAALILRVETRRSVWIEGVRRAGVLASSVTLVLLTITIFNISIVVTGLEFRIADLIYTLSQGNLLLATVFMIIGGVLLGAALPGIAVFFIMVLTFVPVLAEFNIDRQVSYFIAFYVGTLSSISPPVASGVLIASTIAGARFVTASRVTMVMGLPLFIFPFLFVFAPELMLRGTEGGLRTIFVLGITTVSLVAMQLGAAGWMIRRLRVYERSALLMAPVVEFFGLFLYHEGNTRAGDLLLWGSPLIMVLIVVRVITSRSVSSDQMASVPVAAE